MNCVVRDAIRQVAQDKANAFFRNVLHKFQTIACINGVLFHGGKNVRRRYVMTGVPARRLLLPGGVHGRRLLPGCGGPAST